MLSIIYALWITSGLRIAWVEVEWNLKYIEFEVIIIYWRLCFMCHKMASFYSWSICNDKYTLVNVYFLSFFRYFIFIVHFHWAFICQPTLLKCTKYIKYILKDCRMRIHWWIFHHTYLSCCVKSIVFSLLNFRFFFCHIQMHYSYMDTRKYFRTVDYMKHVRTLKIWFSVITLYEKDFLC